MPTYQRIVDGALKEIGVLPAGDSATTEETTDALDRFIWWLDQESINGLLASGRVVLKHTLAAAQLSYTVAEEDADIALTLPAELHVVALRRPFETDPRPLDRISISALMRYRDSDGHDPYLYVVEQSEPAVLRFDASPYAGDEISIVGGTWLTPVRTEVNPGDNVALPRGYFRALVLGLAKELAPSYGVAMSRETMKNCDDAVRRLKARNDDPETIEFDDALLDFEPITL